MKSRRSLVTFTPSGVVVDGAPNMAPIDVYTMASNMRATESGMTRARGVEAYLGPSSTPAKFAMSCVVNGALWFLYMGAAGVYVTDGGAHFDITPLNGWIDFPAGSMTGGLCNGIPVFSAPNRAPWYWDFTFVPGAVKPLPGFLAGSSANVLAPFGQHVFAGSVFAGTTQNEKVAWSDAAAVNSVPATWVPTATNQAGDLLLLTGAGPVNCLRALGPSLMAYRVTGCHSINYVGRPYIYTARRVSAESGAASTNAVADVRGQHVILAPGDLVIADGTSVRSIGEGRVKSSLFGQISEAGLRVSHVFSTPGSGEVWFCLALGNDNHANTAYVWNYERDKWSIRDLPNVTHSYSTYAPTSSVPNRWDNDPGPWETDYRAWNSGPDGGFFPRAVGVGPANLNAWQLDRGDTNAAGDAVAGSCQRIGLSIGNPSMVKHFGRVMPIIDASPGTVVLVQIGSQLRPSDPVQWTAVQPYTVGQSDAVSSVAMGRLFAISFSSPTLAQWSVGGFSVEFSEKGYE